MCLILNIIFGGMMTVLVLFIHHNAPFHFMVSISDEYKYIKRLVKTTFKYRLNLKTYVVYVIYNPQALSSALATLGRYSPGPSGL